MRLKRKKKKLKNSPLPILKLTLLFPHWNLAGAAYAEREKKNIPGFFYLICGGLKRSWSLRLGHCNAIATGQNMKEKRLSCFKGSWTYWETGYMTSELKFFWIQTKFEEIFCYLNSSLVRFVTKPESPKQKISTSWFLAYKRVSTETSTVYGIKFLTFLPYRFCPQKYWDLLFRYPFLALSLLDPIDFNAYWCHLFLAL